MMVGGPCLSEMCQEMRLQRRAVGRREWPDLPGFILEAKEAFDICDTCPSFIARGTMCALDVHPKEGALSLSGVPRATLQASLGDSCSQGRWVLAAEALLW